MSAGRRAFGLADVLVILGALGFVAFLGIVYLQNLRSQGGRVPCASNLRQIGLAIQMYVNDFGEWPRTAWSGPADPNPVPTFFTGSNAASAFAAGGPAANDVTSAAFLLVKVTELSPKVFVCDQDPRAGSLGGDPLKRSNWPGRQNLSYSFQNPYPTKAALDAGYKLSFSLTSDFAIAADMNPGGAALVALRPDMPRSDRRLGNSNNNSGDGQNVLYADGHVEFQSTPFCGVIRRSASGEPTRDNIYTAGVHDALGGAAPAATLASGPLDALDSVLLPAATEGPSPVAPMERKRGELTLLMVSVVLVILGVFLLDRRRARLKGNASSPS